MPGEEGLRDAAAAAGFIRVPDGGVFGRTGCELLRPFLEPGTLRATVVGCSVVDGDAVGDRSRRLQRGGKKKLDRRCFWLLEKRSLSD